MDKIKKNQVLPHQTHAMISMHEIDDLVDLDVDTPLAPDKTSSLDKVEQRAPQKNPAQNLTNSTDKFSISKSSLIDWKINNIKYSLNYQKSTRMEGVRYERYTIAGTEKSIDCSTAKHEQRIEEFGKNPPGGSQTASKSDRWAAELHQRTGEIKEATARLSRAYEERKISYEQEIERYELEINRAKQDHQTVSSRTQQRSFVERTHRFVRDVKNKIGDTFRKVIDN